MATPFENDMLLQPMPWDWDYNPVDPDYELRKRQSENPYPITAYFPASTMDYQETPKEDNLQPEGVDELALLKERMTGTPSITRSIASTPTTTQTRTPAQNVVAESNVEIWSDPDKYKSLGASTKVSGKGGYDPKKLLEGYIQSASKLEGNYGQILGDLDRDIVEKNKRADDTIETLRQYQRAYLDTAQPMLDLTPLATLTDAMTGSNFAKTYRPPENMMDRVQTVQALQMAIDKKKEEQKDNNIKAAQLKLKVELEKEKLLSLNANQARQAGLDLQKTLGMWKGLEIQAAEAKARGAKEKELPKLPPTMAKELNDQKMLWTEIQQLKEEAAYGPNQKLWASVVGKFPRLSEFVRKHQLDEGLLSSFLNKLKGDPKITNAELEVYNKIANVARSFGRLRERGKLQKADEEFWDRVFAQSWQSTEAFITRLNNLHWQIYQIHENDVRHYNGSFKINPLYMEDLPKMAKGDYKSYLKEYANSYDIMAKTPEEIAAIKKSYMGAVPWKYSVKGKSIPTQGVTSPNIQSPPVGSAKARLLEEIRQGQQGKR